MLGSLLSLVNLIIVREPDFHGQAMQNHANEDATLSIKPFQPDNEADVIALWHACGLTRPWNDPAADIARKQTTQPELFFVGSLSKRIVGTAMAGFDGHRGWVYYLAVAPDMHKRGIGRALMNRVEQALTELGCPKINLQIRAENEVVTNFYRALGYQVDPVVSMGKRLIEDS